MHVRGFVFVLMYMYCPWSIPGFLSHTWFKNNRLEEGHELIPAALDFFPDVFPGLFLDRFPALFLTVSAMRTNYEIPFRPANGYISSRSSRPVPILRYKTGTLSRPVCQEHPQNNNPTAAG